MYCEGSLCTKHTFKNVVCNEKKHDFFWKHNEKLKTNITQAAKENDEQLERS